MALDIGDIVRVTDRIDVRTPLRREIGRTLFITRDAELDASGSGKVRAFSGLAEVSDFFENNVNAEGLRGARVYFAQNPHPRDLLIGRFVVDNQPSQIRGGTPGTVTAIEAISTGSFQVGGTNFEGTDFSGDASYAEIAETLQAELRTGTPDGFSDAVVSYQASPGRFVVSFPGYQNFGVFEPHSGGTGADVSVILGLNASNGATFHPGKAEETISQCLDEIVNLDPSFYFVALDTGIGDTAPNSELSTWMASYRGQYSSLSLTPSALTTGDNSSPAALLSARQPERTFVTHSGRDYAALAAAGVMSGIDFTAAGSLLTMKFRKLAGVTPLDLTSSQYTELRRKRVNAYASYGMQSYYGEGTALKPGVWVDVRLFLDWIVETMENAVISYLGSARRVPRTLSGIAGLRNVIAGVCEQGVLNGGLAPGRVSEALAADIRRVTRRADFDGILSTGYLIHFLPLASQTAEQIASREAPAAKIWLKGSSAVHFVDIDLGFGE